MIVFGLVYFVLHGWPRRPGECDRILFGLVCSENFKFGDIIHTEHEQVSQRLSGFSVLFRFRVFSR